MHKYDFHLLANPICRRLLVDQAASATNRVVDRARAWCSMAGIAYVRLCPQLASDIRLDETNDEVLVEMLWRTQAYMHEQREQVRRVVDLLGGTAAS
jgi:calcium-independent phospholipase A2